MDLTSPSIKKADKIIKFMCLLILFVLLLSPISYALEINPELTQSQIHTLESILDDSQIQKIHPVIADKIINQPSKLITFFTGTPKQEVLLQVENEEDLETVSNLIKQNNGIVKQEFEIGNTISAEIPINKIQNIIRDEVIGVTPEFEYQAFLDDSIKSSGIDLAWDSDYTGKDIKIAILDTGIDLDHEMFRNRIVLSESFVNEGESDLHGHGTHCAGIAAGNGEYKGVAYDADLVNAKVLNKYGVGKTSEIIAGINWAVENDVDIISMSFGATYTEYDNPLISTIKDAISQGVVFVVAAGNCRNGCGGFFGVTTPGNVEEIITVGAVDNGNNLASFSSGDIFDDYIKPDFVAPGTDIISSWVDGYETKSGTSMSTPFLAGIIALVIEKEGDLSQSQIKKILEQSSVDLGAQGKDPEYGFGIIDISKLLRLEEIPEEKNEDIKYTKLVINQDIEDYKYQGFESFTKENYSGEVAEYHKGEEILKIGIAKFISEKESEDFFKKIEYTKIEDFNGEEVYKNENANFWFWPHNGDFIWFTYSEEELNYNPVVQKYLEHFEKEIKTFTKTSLIQTRDSLSEILSSNESCITNTGCTDDCDGDSYKTDLSTGECHMWVDYKEKGTIFNDEEDTTNTDKCKNVFELKEYYFSCNDHWEAWCPGQFGPCILDVTENIIKDCRGYGNDWYCDDGQCIQAYVECDRDSDCPYKYEDKCYEGDVYTYSYPGDCINPGTSQAYCSFGSESKSLKKDCGSISYGSWSSYSCPNSDEVSKTRTKYTPICSNAQCGTSSSIDKQIKSENGDDSFCEDRVTYSCSKCTYGQYDCDEVSGDDTAQCEIYTGSQLHCIGDWWTGDKGCCLPGQDWDTSSHICKKQDGQSCSSANECYGGYCVHSFCRSSSTYCGDYHCDYSGESYDNCATDCDPDLGHEDYCLWKGTCNHGEWDCDNDDECSGNLVCKGVPLIYNDGCCNSNENWDYTNHVCFYLCVDNDGDGYGTKAEQRCDKTGVDCNDNNKYINPGASEKCDNTDWDCDGNTKNGFNLNTDFYNCGSCGNVCPGIKDIEYGCRNGICERLKTCIMNGVCEVSEGETSSNCGEDCYGDLEILEIDASSRVDQGQDVTFRALVKNKGTYKDKLKFEGAIVPDYWAGVIYSDMNTLSHDSITKCCPGNEYYDAVEISLNAGADEWVEFNVKAPSTISYDHCNEYGAGDDYYSAWDDSFNVLAGLYTGCKEGYVYKLTKNIEINRKQCNDDTDCSNGEECKHKWINGVLHSTCEAKPCQNECGPLNQYLCEGSLVYECKRSDINECYKKVKVDTCGLFETCNSNTGNCDSVQIKTKLYIENSRGVDVYKQPGDYVTINLNYKGSELIQLEYDHEAFDLLDCSDSFTITKDKKCKFEITDGASGKYEIGLRNGDSKIVKIINYPSVIILTNEEKLKERFNDNSGVNNLLSEAYVYANKDYGIVYDLNDYILTEHPFSSFNSYDEIPENTDIENDYSFEVGEFIKSRSEYCDNIIVLGDDYVVPYYRREVDMNTWVGGGSKEDLIYTDISYIQRTQKTFEDFDDLFIDDKGGYGSTDGKNVKIIYDDDLSYEWENEIQKIEGLLEKNGYKPDFEYVDADDVRCNEALFAENFNGATLIVIGTEENNKAFNCMPFVAGLEARDTVTLEKNPWDGRNYAVVLNTEDIEVLKTFYNLINRWEIVKLKSESAYFFKVGAQTAGYIALSLAVVAATIGTMGTAPIILGTIAAVADTVADVSDATDSCFINRNGFGWCGASLGFAIIPFIPGGPFKGVLKNLDSKVREFIEMGLSKLKKVFGSDVIDDFVRHSDEAIENMKRIDLSLGVNKIDIDSTTFKQLATQQQLEIVEQIGKCENYMDFGDDYIKRIEFADLDVDGRTRDGVIQLNKNTDFSKLKNNVLNHEYAHNYISKKLGGKKIWDYSSVNDAQHYLTEFDEFLTESIAKNKINGHILTDLTDYNTLSKFDNRYMEMVLSKFSQNPIYPDEISKIVALAKKNNPSLYNIYKKFLLETNTLLSNSILELSEEFSKYGEDILMDRNKQQILDSLATKSGEVINIWVH